MVPGSEGRVRFRIGRRCSTSGGPHYERACLHHAHGSWASARRLSWCERSKRSPCPIPIQAKARLTGRHPHSRKAARVWCAAPVPRTLCDATPSDCVTAFAGLCGLVVRSGRAPWGGARVLYVVLGRPGSHRRDRRGRIVHRPGGGQGTDRALARAAAEPSRCTSGGADAQASRDASRRRSHHDLADCLRRSSAHRS